MIKVIERSTCPLIRDAIDEALKEVGKKLGLNIQTVGGGGYTEKDYRIKVEASVIGAGGVVENREVSSFKTLAEFYGMKATDLGREVYVYGTKYTLTGIAPRSRKFPILVKRFDGKGFKLPLQAVKIALGYKVTPEEMSV